MIRGLGEFGAGLIAAFGWLAILFAAGWITDRVLGRLYPPPADPYLPHRSPGNLVSFAIFISLLLLLGLLFGPALHVLKSYSCRSADDYELCMDPPASDPM